MDAINLSGKFRVKEMYAYDYIEKYTDGTLGILFQSRDQSRDHGRTETSLSSALRTAVSVLCIPYQKGL